MTASGEVFVGIDTAKARNAIAVAEGGREGELRYLGEFDNTPDAVAKLIRKLAGRYATLHICYEAGPTGYGLYRQVLALGHDCVVVAPSGGGGGAVHLQRRAYGPFTFGSCADTGRQARNRGRF